MATSRSQQRESIIIGVDFGTTFSGVAWCYTGDPDKIRTVKSWPNNSKSLEKVPTILQYGAKDISRIQWGFQVTAEAPSPLKWFKLLLNEQGADMQKDMQTESLSALNNDDEEPLGEVLNTIAFLPADKTAVDVVTDYLKGIYDQTRKTLERKYPASFSSTIGKETPLQFVVTVPADWPDTAKQLTLQAARAAGIDESYRNIKLVSEPEAAAVHCLQTFHETKDGLQVGDVYVVADCGGGTVDLISYEITEVQPRLRVKECVIGTGGMCGSTELNRRFEKLVKNRMGESEYAQMSVIARSNTMRHFDEYLKPTFCPTEYSEEEDDEFEIETYHCPVPGVLDNSKKGICKGHLVITIDEMNAIFDPTFRKITDLVQAQVFAAETKTEMPVTGVLLVGGFGSSPYLHKHLSAKLRTKTGGGVKVLQPVDAWTAIVRGAVAYGLSVRHEAPAVPGAGSLVPTQGPGGGSLVQSRIARFSYGISANEPFESGFHPSHKMGFNSFTGLLVCKGRMTWFVKRGESIPDAEPIKVRLFRCCPTGAEGDDLAYPEEILCSDLDDPPLDIEHPAVKHLLVFTSDLNGISRKKHFIRKKAARGNVPYWYIPFSMLMRYRGADLEFSSDIGGKALGKGTVEFTHELPKGGPMYG